MRPEIAKKILENYLEERIQKGQGLPIWDEQVAATYTENSIEVWTWRALIKMVYKLRDDEQA